MKPWRLAPSCPLFWNDVITEDFEIVTNDVVREAIEEKPTVDIIGRDVSRQCRTVARKVLAVAQENHCKPAYLAKGSPARDEHGCAVEPLAARGIRVTDY